MKCIAFTHLSPEITEYKLPLILRKRKLKTILFSILKLDKEFYSEAFDEINCLYLENLKIQTILKNFIKDPANFTKFFYRLFKVKADVLVSECPPYHLGVLFMSIFRKRSLLVYFPYDMYITRISKDVVGFSKIKAWWEKKCFKICEAIMHKGPNEELDLVPANYGIKNKPKLRFELYPMEELFINYKKGNKLSLKTKEIHLVHIGSYKKGDALYASMNPVLRNVLKQKLHVHLYLRPNFFTDRELNEITDSGKLKKYLHVHNYVKPKELALEASKYDFGLILSTPSENANKNIMKFAASNQPIVFLEAQLPSIVLSKKTEFINKSIDENYLGFSIKDTTNLKKEILKFDYEKSLDNIRDYREKNSMENNIDKFIEFMDKLII